MIFASFLSIVAWWVVAWLGEASRGGCSRTPWGALAAGVTVALGSVWFHWQPGPSNGLIDLMLVFGITTIVSVFSISWVSAALLRFENLPFARKFIKYYAPVQTAQAYWRDCTELRDWVGAATQATIQRGRGMAVSVLDEKNCLTLPLISTTPLLIISAVLLAVTWPLVFLAVPILDDTWLLIGNWPRNMPFEMISYTQGRPLFALFALAIKSLHLGWPALPWIRFLGYLGVLFSGIFLYQLGKALGARSLASLLVSAVVMSTGGMVILVGPGSWVIWGLVSTLMAAALLIFGQSFISWGTTRAHWVLATLLLLTGLGTYQLFFWVMPALAFWLLLWSGGDYASQSKRLKIILKIGASMGCALMPYLAWWKILLPLAVRAPISSTYGHFSFSPQNMAYSVLLQRPLRIVSEIAWPLETSTLLSWGIFLVMAWIGLRAAFQSRDKIQKLVYGGGLLLCWLLTDVSYQSASQSLPNRENVMLTIPTVIAFGGILLRFTNSIISKVKRVVAMLVVGGILVGMVSTRYIWMQREWYRPMAQEAEVVRGIAQSLLRHPKGIFVGILQPIESSGSGQYEFAWRNFGHEYYARYLLELSLQTQNQKLPKPDLLLVSESNLARLKPAELEEQFDNGLPSPAQMNKLVDCLSQKTTTNRSDDFPLIIEEPPYRIFLLKP